MVTCQEARGLRGADEKGCQPGKGEVLQGCRDRYHPGVMQQAPTAGSKAPQNIRLSCVGFRNTRPSDPCSLLASNPSPKCADDSHCPGLERWLSERPQAW